MIWLLVPISMNDGAWVATKKLIQGIKTTLSYRTHASQPSGLRSLPRNLQA